VPRLAREIGRDRVAVGHEQPRDPTVVDRLHDELGVAEPVVLVKAREQVVDGRWAAGDRDLKLIAAEASGVHRASIYRERQ
jgi:hypothetical protein